MPESEDFNPGADTAAAIGRIRLWLDLHPGHINVASEIGSSSDFQSPGWPYRMYAVDRRDLEAVLAMAERGLGDRSPERG